MSMQDPYATLPPPPAQEGQYPDRFKFEQPGQSVEGYLRDVRMTSPGEYDPCPVLDLQTTQVGPDGQPVCWSVFCNPISLWRQLDSQRPAIGSYLKVTFQGLQGRAKVFALEVAPANGQAPAPPVAQPAPAPMPAPQPQAPAPPFGQAPAGPAPWEQAPVQQQPQPPTTPAAPAPAAPPWGQ